MRRRVVTIVIVEDNQQYLKRIVFELTCFFLHEVQIRLARTYKEAQEIIEQGVGEIFIIDFGLPDGHGLDLIEMIRKRPVKCPIIVQTSEDDLNYQLKIYRKYNGNIVYLTKDELFQELIKQVEKARACVESIASSRIAISSKTVIGSLDAYEICYVMSLLNSNHLHVELYDIETKTYSSMEIKNMNLDQFMRTYHSIGIFLRCERGFIVNIKMVEKVFKADNEILMLPRKNGKEIRINIGGTYKKNVLARMKGLY